MRGTLILSAFFIIFFFLNFSVSTTGAIPIVASDTQQYSGSSMVMTADYAGSFRVKWRVTEGLYWYEDYESCTEFDNGYTMYSHNNNESQVLKNGAALGSLHSTGSGVVYSCEDYATYGSWPPYSTDYSEDISGLNLATNDVITVSGTTSNQAIYFDMSGGDTTPPSYTINQTNSTTAGQDTLFSLYWTDSALAGYIFSFDNGTGIFVNDTYAAMTGTGNWSNVTKPVNSTVGATIRWRVYANDTSENMNASEIFSFITSEAIGQFNITVYNSSSYPDNNAEIKILNYTNESQIVVSNYGNVSASILLGQLYTIVITEELLTNNLTVKIIGLEITDNMAITTQIMRNYTGPSPDAAKAVTPIFAFNDSGLTYENATLYLPNNGAYINRILHCRDWNFTSGNCTSSANWTVNASSDYNVQQNSTHFWFNTSNFDGYGGGSVYLEVDLVTPDPVVKTDVIQNATFIVNATVYCRGGDCGNVSGTLRYNQSSENPDTPINTTSGDRPLYVHETPAYSTKACGGNPLVQDQFCNITWIVNATDSTATQWKIGVNFSSNDTTISSNFTKNSTIEIVECGIDITVNWASIEFADMLVPNTNQNPALGNDNAEYNITINPGSCNADMYIKGTNIENSSLSYSIGVGNLTWSNTSNTYATSYNMTNAYNLVKFDVPPVTNITTWYWMNVPPIYAANYNGTVFIQGVKSGSTPP